MSEKQRNLVGMYFYEVLPEDIEQAISLGVKPLKSGKWALKKYDSSGRTFAHNYNRANEIFGEGLWWSSPSMHEANMPTAGKISQVSGDKVTIDTQDAPGVTTKTTLPLARLTKTPDGKFSVSLAKADLAKPITAQTNKPQTGQAVQVSNDINDLKKLSGIK